MLEKLLAGRYHYAVSHQWTLDWFNQRILRTLVRMKMSGEIDDIIRLYMGGEPLEAPNDSLNRPAPASAIAAALQNPRPSPALLRAASAGQ